MILGIGSDLLKIERIGRLLQRFGDRGLKKLFTNLEISDGYSKGMAHQSAYFAKRFAAKEALLKALGTGMNTGLAWHDMEVYSTPLGQPHMRLSGGALERLLFLTPPNMTPHINLSLTDDSGFAQAVVLLSATH